MMCAKSGESVGSNVGMLVNLGGLFLYVGSGVGSTVSVCDDGVGLCVCDIGVDLLVGSSVLSRSMVGCGVKCKEGDSVGWCVDSIYPIYNSNIHITCFI